MKLILGIVVVIVAGMLAFYFVGGYHSFDPSQQGKDAKKAIKPGMTLKQVLDVAPEAQSFSKLIRQKKKFVGQETETVVPVSPVDFRRSSVENLIADGQVPEGFILHYKYSNRVAFDVHFDPTGRVIGVRDAVTEADLLQLK